MEHTALDLLCLSYVPEILSQIAAGPAGYIHLGMVFISALWTLPLKIIIYHDLSVIAAYMAIV